MAATGEKRRRCQWLGSLGTCQRWFAGPAWIHCLPWPRCPGPPIKIVNRCAITVAPRQPFTDWAQQLQPDQPLPPGAFEPGLYLLPTYDSREEAIELLEQGYEEIFCAELETWSTDPATWPSPRSLALFQEWFAFRFFDLVSDQGQEPLAQVEVDEFFLEDLGKAIGNSPLT